MGKDSTPYSVKTAYQHLTTDAVGVDSNTFKLLWDKNIPLKVGAFCWRVILDRIPTYLNLIKRGITPASGSLLCCFCSNSIEIVEHLFISCRFSYGIWMNVYNWIGLEAALAGTVSELLLQHLGLILGRESGHCWRKLWFSTIWSIWLLRNEVIFKQGSLDLVKVINLIKMRAWFWNKSLSKRNSFSYTDWCINPLVCL